MSLLTKPPRALFQTAILAALMSFACPQMTRAQAELIITEIHYHSVVVGQEFVEIKNVGDEALNFTGWSVSGVGVVSLSNAVIPPGGFLVIAENSVQFQAAYGFSPDGTYSGSLKNSGEEIELEDPTLAVVFSVDYWDGGAATLPEEADRPNWPKDPDGDGYSLVPMSPNVNPDPNDYRNWRPSIKIGGSPGADEPLPNPLLPIFISEIRTRDGANANDAIELFNPNPTDVPIGDWFLTDDVDDPNESPIPAGKVVPAGQYLVLENGVDGVALSLSSQGEAVFLYSADSLGNFTGFVNGLYFEGSGDGKTFSRYINSVGSEQFPAAENTLGAVNATPNIGSVVITEIMYNPATLAGDDEFIEIKNISDSAVALYDPLNTANNWRIEGINFILNGVQPTLAPGEIAIVAQTVGATFLANHPGVPVGTQIFGPYPNSSLSNGGEEVALQRPESLDDVDPNKIAYINVDVVQYDNSSPWPTQADAGGRSLVRIDPEVYGNDPNNWKASLLPNGSAGFIYDFTGAEILVNEVLAHTDLPQTDVIELYNPTDGDVDIGGWFLTDDKNDPTKFTIPAGTIIPAQGFWAVNEDNDANPGVAPANYFGNAFQISSRGDDTFLYSADAGGNLTGYRHGWSFRATVNGSAANGDQTLGRYVDSLGRGHFTKQVRSVDVNRFTPNPQGAANNPPLVGPVVFTEIYAEPAPGGVEFIELKNITDQTIALYDTISGGNSNNNWSLDGVTFTYPGVRPTLPPGAVVVILPLNTNVESFRLSYNVPDDPNVIVIGAGDGYLGALNNGGEELALLRPDKPDQVNGATIVPLILVDLVNYNDAPEWPSTEAGLSLEKIAVDGFSDDPIHWRASAAADGTPGVVPDPVDFSYDGWAADNFTAAELANPAISDCDGDVNGDGVANIYAYAFGYDPHITPAGDLLPQGAMVADSGSSYLAINFRQRILAPDLTYEIESSTDLSTWSVIPGQQIGEAVDNGDGTQTVQFRTTVPTSAGDRMFMRVRITKI